MARKGGNSDKLPIAFADALGLSYWRKTSLVILPQALRIVIPPLVNTFIGFFKDTSLFLIIGIFDLLTTGKTVLAEPEQPGDPSALRRCAIDDGLVGFHETRAVGDDVLIFRHMPRDDLGLSSPLPGPQ